MNFDAKWQASAFSVLAAAIALLALNFGEEDIYFEGIEDKSRLELQGIAAVLPAGISREAVCECECEHCHHLAEVEEGRTVFTVKDSDGWYRLFWAGDDVYHFADPSYFFAALEGSNSWTEAAGERTVTVRYARGCPHEEPAHACASEIPERVRLRYRLVLDAGAPEPAGFVRDPLGTIQIPVLIPGEMTRLYNVQARGQTHVVALTMSWALAAPPEVTYASCRCP